MEGTKLTLEVDTGTQGLLLTQEAARRASRTVAIGSLIGGSDDEQRQGFSTGVGGSRVVNYIQVQRLDIGRVHGSFGASVADMDIADGDQKFDGLIGMAALGGFDIDFDVPGHELRLYETEGKCSVPAVALDEPIYSMPLAPDNRKEARDRERIDVQINGQTLRALIDSGAANTLIFGPSAARAGLSTSLTGPDRVVKGSGIGGDVKLIRQRVDTMTVGPLTFHNVPVVVDPEGNAEADMLLGRNFFTQVHVWLSNSSHTLVLQYPPKPSPPIVMGN